MSFCESVAEGVVSSALASAEGTALGGGGSGVVGEATAFGPNPLEGAIKETALFGIGASGGSDVGGVSASRT